MKFPAYVPAAVRAELTAQIDSNEALLRAPRPSIKAATVSTTPKILTPNYNASMRAQSTSKASAEGANQQLTKGVLAMLAERLDCLRRLATDERMRDAFAWLTSEFTDDEQWRGFFYAAVGARMDYELFRKELKQAKDLRNEIADAADTLAKLIRKHDNIGVDRPDEFNSVTELLRKTDNHKGNDIDLGPWRVLRSLVLGEVQEEGELVISGLVPGNAPEIDPEEKVRATIQYGWSKAPDFSALLDTLSKATRDFTPSERGMICAATKTRERNTKTEYLRAFGHLLTEVHHLTLTATVRHAMAITANVAINLPDVDATYDDVRKALARPGGSPLENSGEK